MTCSCDLLEKGYDNSNSSLVSVFLLTVTERSMNSWRQIGVVRSMCVCVCVLLVIAVLDWGSSECPPPSRCSSCALFVERDNWGLSESARHKERQRAIRTVLPVGKGSPVTGYVLGDDSLIEMGQKLGIEGRELQSFVRE